MRKIPTTTTLFWRMTDRYYTLNTFRKIRLLFSVRCAAFLVTCAIILTLIMSCHSSPSPRVLAMKRDAADSVVNGMKDKEQLDSLVKEAEKSGDYMLEMRSLQKRGRLWRDENRFMKAIACHNRELELARKLGDTIATVQALNNIGTNFRRMGVLDEAVDYHYRALHLGDLFSRRNDKTAMKNRVVSLNGIGNISLTLGDTETADSMFRAALKGEKTLGSHLGQAINYANIGSVFEKRNMLDSAWACYKQSMQQNRLADSDLGISLCYTHFGRLFEKQGRRTEAIAEYRKAYEIMGTSEDRWHAMEPCLALAEIYIKIGDENTAMTYLATADRLAHDLHSLEHQAQIAKLYYDIYAKKDDCRRALHYYRTFDQLSDSLTSEKNIVHMQNMRVRYEHEQRRAEVNALNEEYQTEKSLKWVSIMAAVLLFVLGGVTMSFMLYALRSRKRKQMEQHQMEEMRISFFTNITHEFRTPLTVILGYSRMMEEGKVPAGDMAKVGSMVSRQGTRLLSLINQLLDIQKVKSNIGHPDWHHGDIVLFMANIIESHLNMAHSRQITLMYAPKQKKMMCDFVPDYAQKVLCNLLTNAIKFSKEGGQVLVALEVENDMLILRIADYGSGIPENEQQHIFEPFYQTESDKKAIGSGVGLALVNQIVKTLGGSITLDSKVDVGSVFTVNVPVKAPAGVDVKPLESLGTIPDDMLLGANTKTGGNNGTSGCGEDNNPVAGDKSDALVDIGANSHDMDDDGGDVADGSSADTRQLVLIVEDNADVAEYMTMQLKARYRLVLARDGEEGLRIATETVPDIIITDLMMPRMDGYELCQRVKESEVLNHIPVIIVTARTTQKDKLRGLQIGVDAYIYKPFDAEELSVTVGNLLEKHRLLRLRYMQAPADDKQAAVETLPPCDRVFLNRVDAAVDELMATDLSVDSVAIALCMSQQQLRRKLNAVSGDTPMAYFRKRQMQKAKDMLDNRDDMSISEIGMKCGFYDMSHFTRIFKQVVGITPSQYRKKA